MFGGVSYFIPEEPPDNFYGRISSRQVENNTFSLLAAIAEEEDIRVGYVAPQSISFEPELMAVSVEDAIKELLAMEKAFQEPPSEEEEEGLKELRGMQDSISIGE